MPLADVAELEPDAFTEYAGTVLLHSLKLRIFYAPMHRTRKKKPRKSYKEASQETRTPFGFRARRNQHSPKSNRMPDASHSVKVVSQIVDGIQDLRQDFIRRI